MKRTILTKKILALTGTIIFLVPVTFLVLWIHAFYQPGSFADRVNMYLSYFPAFLRGPMTISLLSIVLCMVAVGLNAINLANENKLMKAVSLFIVIAGSLLGFLNLFSMM